MRNTFKIFVEKRRKRKDARRFNFTYTGCPRKNGQNFGRVFLMLDYTDITQNTYIQS